MMEVNNMVENKVPLSIIVIFAIIIWIMGILITLMLIQSFFPNLESNASLIISMINALAIVFIGFKDVRAVE